MKDQTKNDYKKFQIPKKSIPAYNNPNDFTSNFKRCSILKPIDISYSNNTKQLINHA